jgi:hypothetical protein
VLNVSVQTDLYSEWKVWLIGEYTFDTETDVNGTTERITIVDHSMHTGQRVFYDKLGGTEAIGLTDQTFYFVRNIDRDTFELYDTKANAEGGPATTGRLDLTASGGGLGESHGITADNSKWLPAFRSAGGDPLTPGVEAGAYFFLQNQVGADWRIISTDEDQTVNYNGNLVGEVSAVSLIVATPGRTVLHLGLQPVTQRVDEILNQTQEAAYNGVVAIDVLSSNSGTEFPTGTRSNPVNNISDAATIAGNLGIQTFEFRGLLTLNQAYPSWTFRGVSAEKNDLLDLNGFSVDKSIFRSCGLQGSYTGQIEAVECDLNLLTGVNGSFRRCGISANMSLASGAAVIFANCFSEVPGSSTPVINCSGALSLNVRNYSGGIELTNADNALFVASVDLDPGTLIIDDASNTQGTVLVRGTGTLQYLDTIGTTLINRLLDSDKFNQMHGQLEREIFIDTSLVPAGNGFQQSPYNNVTNAIDDAEANGITALVFLNDATLDRQLRNFRIKGVGSPAIDVNNQNIDGCEFMGVEVDGVIGSGSIVARQSIIRTNVTGLAGDFYECGFDGNLTLATGAVLNMVDCFSTIGGLARPTLSINGALSVSLRSYRGGLTVQNCASPSSEVTVSMAQGRLTLAATCTAGTISVRGVSQFTNSAAGSAVDETGLLNTEELAIALASLVGNADVSGDDLTVEIKDAGLNIVRTLSVSADGRVRRIV